MKPHWLNLLEQPERVMEILWTMLKGDRRLPQEDHPSYVRLFSVVDGKRVSIAFCRIFWPYVDLKIRQEESSVQ
jgi:hypothetical protein